MVIILETTTDTSGEKLDILWWEGEGVGKNWDEFDWSTMGDRFQVVYSVWPSLTAALVQDYLILS